MMFRLNPLSVLPDFQNYEYKIAVRPAQSTLKAWDKLEECERRLIWYQFVEEYNSDGPAMYRVLLDDAVSAFLLTFEAVLQVLKDQVTSVAINGKTDDLILRGLRTMRHLVAHVDAMPVKSNIAVTIGVSTSRTWRLPKLTTEDLVCLRSPQILETELDKWAEITEKYSVGELLKKGLESLVQIVGGSEELA